MIDSSMLLAFSALVVASAGVTVAAGTGRLKRNPLLSLRAPWINKSDVTWVAGHRAGAWPMCAVAAVVTLLSLVVVVLRSAGVDVDGLAFATAILMPVGVGVAAAVAGVAAYRAVPDEFSWRNDPIK